MKGGTLGGKVWHKMAAIRPIHRDGAAMNGARTVWWRTHFRYDETGPNVGHENGGNLSHWGTG